MLKEIPLELLFPVLWTAVSGYSFPFSSSKTTDIKPNEYSIICIGLQKEGFKVNFRFRDYYERDFEFIYDEKEMRIWIDKALEEDRPEAVFLNKVFGEEEYSRPSLSRLIDFHREDITRWYLRLYLQAKEKDKQEFRDMSL